MPDDSGQGDAVENTGGGGLMTGNRGWIIVLAVVVLEAAFFVVLLKFHSDTTPANADPNSSLASLTPSDFMKIPIPLDKLAYSIPTPSGQPKTLAMDLVIVLGRTDTEVRDNIQLQDTDWAMFKQTVDELVPWIKDQLNRAINKMSASELDTDRGQQQIRDTVKEKINGKLDELKLKLSNEKINKRRVTDVLITSYYFN